ncbi:MAG: YraN family protein [Brevinema sp.]
MCEKKNNLSTNKKQSLGRLGEKAAKKYLIDQDFEFVTENYFTRFGEIDLIVKKDNILIFVEVKTRRNNKNFDISINQSKAKKIYASAEIFIEDTKIVFSETRFDAIFITINKRDQVAEIGHRPNFF